MTSIILYAPRNVEPQMLKRSRANPNEILVVGSHLIRNGAAVQMAPNLRRLFLVLAVRQGSIVPHQEIIDALYGDDPDGGPENARKCVEVSMTALRDAGAALGFRIVSYSGRGYELALVDRLEAAA